MEHSLSKIHITITQLKICNCVSNSVLSIIQTAFSSRCISILRLSVCYSIGQILETFNCLSEITLSFSPVDRIHQIFLGNSEGIIWLN